jgi:peptidoglycan-associated lipoprotein
MTKPVTMNGRTILAVLLMACALAACGKKVPPVPVQPPLEQPPAVSTPPSPPAQPVTEALPVPPQPLQEDALSDRSLDDLNRDSPLRPAFFPVDGFDLDAEARAIVSANAELLRRYPTWMITIEGHCDERGTAEYNLALGERRAIAARTYLVSLGIAPNRVRTVSYGKEFPFDPGHDEVAWSANRRAHFVITAK